MYKKNQVNKKTNSKQKYWFFLTFFTIKYKNIPYTPYKISLKMNLF